MDILKKLFPLSFTNKKDVVALIINVLIQLVVGIGIGVLIAIFVHLPIVGWIIGICGGLVDLYVLVGIILSILDYLKVLK